MVHRKPAYERVLTEEHLLITFQKWPNLEELDYPKWISNVVDSIEAALTWRGEC